MAGVRALGVIEYVEKEKAVAENRRSYVLVNNRAEGNAPLTVQELVDLSREWYFSVTGFGRHFLSS